MGTFTELAPHHFAVRASGLNRSLVPGPSLVALSGGPQLEGKRVARLPRTDGQAKFAPHQPHAVRLGQAHPVGHIEQAQSAHADWRGSPERLFDLQPELVQPSESRRVVQYLPLGA